MSNTEIALLERQYLDQKQKYEADEQTFGNIAEPTKELLTELDAVPENKRTAKYLALRSAVENYSKLGTTDFEYKINGRKMKPSERQMREPKLAFFGMNAVTAAAMEYSKENKELGLKAAGMVWKQQEHRAVIKCPAGENADSAQKNLDVITAEKRVRGMARQSVTPEQDYVRRSKEAKDQLALIGHEYESGKLSWWRGSQQCPRR